MGRGHESAPGRAGYRGDEMGCVRGVRCCKWGSEGGSERGKGLR